MKPVELVGAIIAAIAAAVGAIKGVIEIIKHLHGQSEDSVGPSDSETNEEQPAPVGERPVSTSDETSVKLPSRSVPHNLPPRNQFVGRKEEIMRVHEALLSRSYLISIDGIGGIGKTSLALEVAYHCLAASKQQDDSTVQRASFAGFIWTTAKDRTLELNDLMDCIARTLDYPGIIQQPLDEKQYAVRRLLQEAPYLLIVDNFETITDDTIREFLWNLPEPSKALITTREQKLHRAWTISLHGLEPEEALNLIRAQGNYLGLESLEQGKERILRRLVKATGGVPLAIKWAIGQIKRRGQSLETVLAALYEARGDIFDVIFDRSWNLLSPGARQVLMVMPIFATSASRSGIEVASSIHHFALDEVLGELVEMSLVDVTDELEEEKRRYSIHPLTRSFAKSRFHQKPELEDDIYNRLLNFYHEFTTEHGGFWNRQGFEHLEPELPNILKVIQQSYRIALDESDEALLVKGMETFHNIIDFMVIRGDWNDVLNMAELSISASRHFESEYWEAVFRVWPIGWIQRHRGDLEAAEDNTRWAIDIFSNLQRDRYLFYAKRNLGRILQEQGNLEGAEDLMRATLEFYESIDDERHIYFVTANLADILVHKGKRDEAWNLCSNILPAVRRLEDPERVAAVLSVLAKIESQRQNYRESQSLWQEALTNMERADRLDGIADCIFELARLEKAMGNELKSKEMFLEALDNYQRLELTSRIDEIKRLLQNEDDSGSVPQQEDIL
jgi:LuxR family glucitol operon transcriptional activator